MADVDFQAQNKSVINMLLCKWIYSICNKLFFFSFLEDIVSWSRIPRRVKLRLNWRRVTLCSSTRKGKMVGTKGRYSGMAGQASSPAASWRAFEGLGCGLEGPPGGNAGAQNHIKQQQRESAIMGASHDYDSQRLYDWPPGNKGSGGAFKQYIQQYVGVVPSTWNRSEMERTHVKIQPVYFM